MIVRKFRLLTGSLKRKLAREKLPVEDIAAGWALGVFIGCAIPFGLQLILAIPLAMMMRVSKIGATAGTFISNPVSILFIYPAQTYFVNRLLFGGSLSFEKLQAMEWTRKAVLSLGTDVIISFFLGGILVAFVCTPIAYFAVKALVVRARQFRERKALKRGE